MIALRIEFPAGKFHANPWDRGTDDEVEWPPSPWRMLRAIAAGWHRSGAGDHNVFLRVLAALAGPPAYLLPRATAGHSHHYVPLGGSKGGKLERTLILDSFLSLERGNESVVAAYVTWPRATLTSNERTLLERSCAAVSHLGSVESRCNIAVVDAPEYSEGFAVVDIASRIDGGGPIALRLAADPSLPTFGLLRALSETTCEMRRDGRLGPPGTTWVEYRLPDDYLLVREQYEAREREQPAFSPTILRFIVERAALSVLPPITQAVSIAEVMRRAAMARYSDMNGGTATTRLAGKTEDGSAKREGHDHPFYLSSDSHASGRVDRIDVWFPQGCTHAEYRAVTSIEVLKDRLAFEGELTLRFLGSVEPLRARVWTTATPVVLDRFPKVRGINGSRRVVDAPDEQLRAMIMRRLDEPCEVELLPHTETVPLGAVHGTRLDAFRHARRGKRPTHPIVGATITFDREVAGPIVLGQLAHFGLGRFEPCEA
jgi:CRISPR-associated protein Csb2